MILNSKEIVPYSKQIFLTQGEFATVSYHWYYFLIQWKWHLVKDSRGRVYASHSFRIKKDSTKKVFHFKMHRLILGLNHFDSRIIDHKDHNGLNNTISNIRIANKTQNCTNTLSRKNSVSKYLGVSLMSCKGKNVTHNYWRAQITVLKSKKHIGLFPYTMEGEIKAAKSYDEKAKENFKDFANLNFPL